MLHASLKNGVTSLTQRAASGLSGVHGPTLGMQGASWQASRCRAVAFDQSQHGLSTSARWVTRAAAAGKHMRLSQRGCVLARCQTASGFSAWQLTKCTPLCLERSGDGAVYVEKERKIHENVSWSELRRG